MVAKINKNIDWLQEDDGTLVGYRTNRNVDLPLGGGANLSSAAVFLPPTDDYAGIMAASDAALAAGGGTVQLKAITYNIGGNTIPLRNGVVYQGAGNVFNYSGAIAPDFGLLPGTGTIIRGNGTAAAFAYNDTPRGAIWASQIALSVDGISNTGVENLCIDGALHGIMCGNLYASGAWWSVFKKVVAMNCTGWGFYFENFQHVMFDNLYAINCAVGHHFYGASGSNRCNLGNSSLRDIFQTYGPLSKITTKHLVIQARDPLGAGSSINNLVVTNVAGVSGSSEQSAGGFTQTGCTFNGSTANINVTDGSKFPVGMPFTFTALTGATNLSLSPLYFVRTQVGNVITVSAAKESGTAIIPNAAGTCSIRTIGFPPFSAEGIDNSSLTNFAATGVDTEGGGGSLIFLQGMRTEGNKIELGGGIGGSLTNVFSAITSRLNNVLSIQYLSQPRRVDFDATSDRVIILGWKPQAYATSPSGFTYGGVGFGYDGDPLAAGTPNYSFFMDGSNIPIIRFDVPNRVIGIEKWFKFRQQDNTSGTTVSKDQGTVITGRSSTISAPWTQILPTPDINVRGCMVFITNPTAFACTVSVVGGGLIHHAGAAAANNTLAANSAGLFVCQYDGAAHSWARCN